MLQEQLQMKTFMLFKTIANKSKKLKRQKKIKDYAIGIPLGKNKAKKLIK